VSEEGVEFRSNVDGKKIFLSPEKAMQVQASLGSDMVSLPFPPLETGTSFSRTRDMLGATPPS
jgi:tRNA-guanine family transglycosylase